MSYVRCCMGAGCAFDSRSVTVPESGLRIKEYTIKPYWRFPPDPEQVGHSAATVTPGGLRAVNNKDSDWDQV